MKNKTARIIRQRVAQTPRILIKSLAVLLIVGLSLPAHAAFQEKLWGARPAGLSGAFTALADDVNAPAYNPAGISLLDHHSVTFMYAQLFTGLDLNVGNNETSHLGLNYLSVSPQIQNKRFGSFALSWANFQATHLMREDALTLTYADAHRFEALDRKPLIAYGANLKFLRRSFTTDSSMAGNEVFAGGRDSSAMTADVGLMVRPNFNLVPGLKFGLSAQNITEPDMGLKYTDRVPARYTFGVAYQDLKYRLLNPAIDIAHRDGETLVTFAWEGWMMRDTFAFRLGGNEDQFGGGLGYQFQLFDGIKMRFDYALIWPLAVEGTNGSHRISLTTDF